MVMRGLLLLLVGCASALHLPSAPLTRRNAALSLGLALALAPPSAAHASRSKMIERRRSKEASEKAKAFKFSKPSEPSEDWLANERRRNDFAAGITPRDANRVPVRDSITGKNVRSTPSAPRRPSAGLTSPNLVLNIGVRRARVQAG